MLKSAVKKLVPTRLLVAYHRGLSALAAWRFGHPSLKMVVVGVTGTNGKSTTANLIGAVLEAAGEKVGVTTTVNFRVAGEEWLNDTKMTMLGRTRLQKLLARMVRAGCGYAVVETSSEGIKQRRHADIAYDVAVFTNLTPEHLESHGGFDAYKKAKGELFAKVSRDPRKTLRGRPVPKVIVANLDSPHAGYFLGFPADRKIGFTRFDVPASEGVERVSAEGIELRYDGSTFSVGGVVFSLHLPGAFNVENALAAVAVGLSQGVSLAEAARGLAAVPGVPGRMEFVGENPAFATASPFAEAAGDRPAGRPSSANAPAGRQTFKVLVDYAPEPESFRQLYGAVALLPHRRVIHVLGSCGGGRDRDRRPVLGELAARNADVVIVTNEDPYDDDPMQIIREVASGASAAGKREGEDLFLILDRREALQRAVDLAEPGDLVIATGKGAEQAICVAGGRKIPWDEREELRKAIRNRYRRQESGARHQA
jgi:UDP-N-acetylmuramoyl-L-alanyl-D-glutamate--2,6-diaminopimelate ligase